MMPEKMESDSAATLVVKNMDGNILNPQIVRETAYTGCSAPRVCYGITHSNT